MPERMVAGPAPDEVYRHLYRPDLKGIRLTDISLYLETMGFRAFTFRGNWADVEEQLGKGRPVIAGLKKRPTKAMHFVVVTAADDGNVWLNDPTRRKASRIERDKFEQQWSIADRWLLLAVPPGPE